MRLKKLENKLVFCFKNKTKDTIITEKDEDVYRKDKICRFCEKNIECDKVRDHCHLTGKYRGPAHRICNIDVTQDSNNFIPFIFHNLLIMIVIYFLKNYLIKTRSKF